MKKKFELRRPDLLPPLTTEQAENLIKFIRLNADQLENLYGEIESCCFGDDGRLYQSFVYDAIKLGYGLIDLKQYLADRGYDEDDKDDE